MEMYAQRPLHASNISVCPGIWIALLENPPLGSAALQSPQLMGTIRGE